MNRVLVVSLSQNYSLSLILIQKENHRVQVFQSDGTFVGKFGSMGNRPGQLEHPHYIAVSSTNRVIGNLFVTSEIGVNTAI